MRKKLTKKELKYFKELILEKKNQVWEEIDKISEDTLKKSQKDAAGDISGYTLHMADLATDAYDREFSLGLVTNEHRLLYEIDDALKRIEESTYGICEDCSKPISKSRLKAIPYTRFCLRCQKEKEKG